MDGYIPTEGGGAPSSSAGDSHIAHSNVYLRPVPPNGWDEARLIQFFSSFGDVDSVRISHPTPGSRAGVAHAFIRFRDPDAAQAAINALQGTLLDGLPIVVKLADADMAPRIQSGLCASEWCYARGLPAHLSREDVAAIFATYGQVQDLKHFPSTEFYRGSGALVQYELVEASTAAIQALNGCMLPGSTQPLLVRYADSPAEKAAKAARKERLNSRGGSLNGLGAEQLGLQEQIQQQLLELSLRTSMGAGLAAPGFQGAGLAAGQLGNPAFGDTSAWLAAAGSGGVPGAQMGGPNPQLNRGSNGQGCSIYIKGMPEDADKLWLYEKFSRFGGIISVRVLLDEHSGRCNGIGFVNYSDPEGARAAHETMNGVSMGERLLHVMVQSHGAGRNSGSGGRLSNNSLNAGNGGGGGNNAGMAANGLQGPGPYIPGGVTAALQQQQQQSADFINQGNW